MMNTLDKRFLGSRKKVTSSQSEALDRRLRGLMNAERRTVRVAKDLSESQILGVMDETSKQILTLLVQFEPQVVQKGWEEVVPNQPVPKYLESMALHRAQEVEEQFRTARWAHFNPKSLNYNLYERLLTSIAETEVFWAYNRGNLGGWVESGVDRFITVHDEICTGCCPESTTTAASFRGGFDGMPPFHSGCGCLVMPA